MKKLFTINCTILFCELLIVMLLSLSCSKDESNSVTPLAPSLTNTAWKLESLSFSYTGTLIDQSNWKTTILNSGLVTLLGTVTILITDTSYSVTSQLDSSYSSFFPSRLTGICSGKILINDGLLVFHSEAATGTFELGKNNQEAYASYTFSGTKLKLVVVTPTYLKTDSIPSYINVGEEYYRCTFGAK